MWVQTGGLLSVAQPGEEVRPPLRGFSPDSRRRIAWILAIPAALALGALIAVLCDARPGFDASGWLTWGRQTWPGQLNLDGAPSWKPLSFIFTLPYALTDRGTQTWLWMITSLGGAVGAPVMAGRLAWRLAPHGGARTIGGFFPRLLAAAIAAGAVITLTVGSEGYPMPMGFLHQALIVTSDPLALTLWLLAIDRVLSGRYGWALLCIWLVALARPEAWVFLLGLGLWLIWKRPRLRLWALSALIAVPVAWFIAPGVCSHSWLSAGDFNLNQATAIHGDKIVGVLDRVRTLTGRAIQVEVGAGILLCLAFRDRRTILVACAGALWAAVEIAFALHGFSAVQRYIVEAGTPLAIAGGVGAGYAVTWPGRRLDRVRPWLCMAGGLAVVGFAVALIPFARTSADAARGIVEGQHLDAREYDNLDRLVQRVGGPGRVLACGSAATTLGWQSTLALDLDLNVGEVGYGSVRHFRTPVAYFSRRGARWTLALLNPPRHAPASCRELDGASD